MEPKKEKMFCDELFLNVVHEYSFEELRAHKWKRKQEELISMKLLQDKVDMLEKTIEVRQKEVEDLKEKIKEIAEMKEKDREREVVKEKEDKVKDHEQEKPIEKQLEMEIDKENMVKLIKEVKEVKATKEVSEKEMDDKEGKEDETSTFSVFLDVSTKSNGPSQSQSSKQALQNQPSQPATAKADNPVQCPTSKAQITVTAPNQTQILPADQTRRKSLVKPKLSTLVEDSRESRSSTNPSSSSSQSQAPPRQMTTSMAPPLPVSQPSAPSSQTLPSSPEFIKPVPYTASNVNPPPPKRVPLGLRPDPSELVDFSINPAIHRGSTCFRMSEGFSIFLPNSETECIPKQASTPDGKARDKEN